MDEKKEMSVEELGGIICCINQNMFNQRQEANHSLISHGENFDMIIKESCRPLSCKGKGEEDLTEAFRQPLQGR
jgi:hypothetical protein